MQPAKLGNLPLLAFGPISINLVKDKEISAALQVNLTFGQVLALVKQLPRQEKIKLSKEPEKEGIETKLENLLNAFRTKALSLDTINEEVEMVRQQMYDGQAR